MRAALLRRLLPWGGLLFIGKRGAVWNLPDRSVGNGNVPTAWGLPTLQAGPWALPWVDPVKFFLLEGNVQGDGEMDRTRFVGYRLLWRELRCPGSKAKREAEERGGCDRLNERKGERAVSGTALWRHEKNGFNRCVLRYMKAKWVVINFGSIVEPIYQ